MSFTDGCSTAQTPGRAGPASAFASSDSRSGRSAFQTHESPGVPGAFRCKLSFGGPFFRWLTKLGDLLPSVASVSALRMGRIFSGFRIDSLVGEDTKPNQNLMSHPFALFLAKGREQNLAEHFARQLCQCARVQSVLHDAGLHRRNLGAVDPLARDLQLQGAFDGPQFADLRP